MVSGGQTGVDRAALDAALVVGLAIGGWCPRGRRAEDGVIPLRYGLRETGGRAYHERTGRNVAEADATLIVTREGLSGGTALTRRLARLHDRPCYVLDLARSGNDPCEWLRRERVETLNVAGPRESQRPGIYAQALELLRRLLAECV